MTSHLHLRIIDTPLVDTHRASLVTRMATTLVRCGAYADHDAAFDALRAWSFRTVDITMCIDDARQAAFQQTVDVVAREMVKP